MFVKSILWQLVFMGVLLALACEVEDTSRVTGTTDTDGDTDTDTDTDTDSDTDSDSDGDTSNPGGLGCQGMDILFVIDDSGSMQEEQDNLATNFPKFIDVLDKYKTDSGSSINYRVGVTTTSVTRNFRESILGIPFPRSTTGIDGLLLGQDTEPEPNCGLSDPWIEGPGSGVDTTFSCMAQVGTLGDATEMPFAALEGALSTEGKGMSRPGGPNEGFYRKDQNSLLVVVVITDEDDCSMENGGVIAVSFAGGSDCAEKQSTGIYMPQDIKDFLDQLTGGEGRYVVVGIGGPKACSSDFGSAIKARRLQNLVNLCGDYGVFGDICQGDLWYSLEEALEVMTLTCSDMPPV